MKHVALSHFSRNALHKCAVADASNTDILLVGAFADRENRDMLDAGDDQYLGHIFPELAGEDVDLSDQPEVSVSNFIYGHNFLKMPASAHVVVFCKVNYDPYNRDRANQIDRRLYKQCVDTAVEGIWHRALLATGARYAVNVHRNDIELPTGHLARTPFKLFKTVHRGGMVYDFLARDDTAQSASQLNGTCTLRPMSSNP